MFHFLTIPPEETDNSRWCPLKIAIDGCLNDHPSDRDESNHFLSHIANDSHNTSINLFAQTEFDQNKCKYQPGD
jgi:hypothetical protein